ncbi:MAG: protein of unknown function (DUF4258) [Chloroflexi bacterium]|jgi:hypothetical protein|nr:MAG: protein of unknown function (DUF4258) [Chloroflexota bacterium]
MDVRLTDHAWERIEQEGIRRTDIDRVLEAPDRRIRDAWVEKYIRAIEGRDICVVVTTRIPTVTLVVTAYPLRDH